MKWLSPRMAKLLAIGLSFPSTILSAVWVIFFLAEKNLLTHDQAVYLSILFIIGTLISLVIYVVKKKS